jgi:transposase InsO family protein
MKQHFPAASVDSICRLFGKSRQAFYQHLTREADSAMEEAFVINMVKATRSDMPRIGSLKLHFLLRSRFEDHHITMGRDRFCALLRANDLMVKTRRKYLIPRTTNSDHPYRKWPDLTPGLVVSRAGQLWVSDITYVRTKEDGFVYLSLVTDAFSRKIVGHHLSHTLSARGALSALNKAIAALGEGCRVVHHSDRGIQYCCGQYVSRLKEEGIAISMTQSGSPYENAQAERVNGILKTELGLNAEFSSYRAALQGVAKAIDTYNRLRPHMSCGMLTPHQAHGQSAPGPGVRRPVRPLVLKGCKPKSVH